MSRYVTMRGLTLPRERVAARSGLALFHPVTKKSLVMWHLLRLGLSAGAARLLEPSEVGSTDQKIDHLLAAWPCATFAALTPRDSNRLIILGMDEQGRPIYVAKVALDADATIALRTEASALRQLAPRLDQSLTAPAFLAEDVGIVVTRPINWSPRLRPRRMPVELARALGVFFRGTNVGAGATHGDFTPWNVLKTDKHWVAIDWEYANEEGPPFFDVLHYLVSGSCLLGRPTIAHLVHRLARNDGPEWAAINAYAQGAKLNPGSWREGVAQYVEGISQRRHRSERDSRLWNAALDRLKNLC